MQGRAPWTGMSCEVDAGGVSHVTEVQAYCGEEGLPPELVQGSLSHDFFSAPAQWWHNRRSKLTSRHPDFKHKKSKAALWLNSRYKPAWVDSQLATWGAGAMSLLSLHPLQFEGRELLHPRSFYEGTNIQTNEEVAIKLVLSQKHNNMYAANGIGVVLAEKGLFDSAKEIFTQVQESAAGNITVEMPDVWINLAHVFLAQGQFALAVKMYQNPFICSPRTAVHSSAALELRSIHLQPSNYTLRFDAAIAMQKYSTTTLQKVKRTADEVRQSVAELKNALRLAS